MPSVPSWARGGFAVGYYSKAVEKVKGKKMNGGNKNYFLSPASLEHTEYAEKDIN
jgi:hypothetical protein